MLFIFRVKELQVFSSDYLLVYPFHWQFSVSTGTSDRPYNYRHTIKYLAD